MLKRLVALVVILVAVDAAARSGPVRDIYWLKSPVADPFTVIIWNFGDDLGDLLADDDLEGLLDDSPGNDDGIFDQNAGISYRLTGGAKVTERGRF